MLKVYNQLIIGRIQHQVLACREFRVSYWKINAGKPSKLNHGKTWERGHTGFSEALGDT